MTIIKYSFNWNGKLHHKVISWSTIRLRNSERYKLDFTFNHKLIDKKGNLILEKQGMLIYKKNILLNEITEPMARIDTGYSRIECINLIKTMYKNQNFNWDIKRLSFMIFTSKI